ncbi:MAG: hypothetical protein PHF67_04940 [Candidatus Nanoarchaeia archaeon]|nr:hypothetical protein [Candidatus Nanoarchaeia archaeon]
MAVLEQVMQLKEQGYSEQDIINYLKEEGISPKEIYDSLAQSNIKSELSREAAYNQGVFPATPGNKVGDGDYSAGSQTMSQQGYSLQPSMMTQESKAQQIPAEYPEQYANYPQAQQEYQNYPEYQTSDVETITGIAEQLIEEKNEKIQKQISVLLLFKEEISTEIERISQRIEKIESNFNNLQASIIRRVGEYGEDIKNIGKEMRSTQESFSKLINPIIDNSRVDEERTEIEKAAEESPKLRKTKKNPGFEDYLR